MELALVVPAMTFRSAEAATSQCSCSNIAFARSMSGDGLAATGTSAVSAMLQTQPCPGTRAGRLLAAQIIPKAAPESDGASAPAPSPD